MLGNSENSIFGLDSILRENNNKVDRTTENIIIFIFSLVIILGFFGNALVIFTVVINKHMRTPSNLFTINLAISDLTLCVFSIPFMTYKALRHTWIFGDFMCRMTSFYQASNVFLSTFSITAIAIDRYFSVVYAKNVRKNKSLNINNISDSCWSMVSLVLIWIFAFILSSPLFIYSSTEDLPFSLDSFNFDDSDFNITSEDITLNDLKGTLKNPTERLVRSINENYAGIRSREVKFNVKINHCVETWPMKETKVLYSYGSLLMQYILPIVIVGIAYGRIWWKLNKHRKRLKSYPHTNIPNTPEIQRNLMSEIHNNKNNNNNNNNNNKNDQGENLVRNSHCLSTIVNIPANQSPSSTPLKPYQMPKKGDNRQKKMNILLAFIALIFAASWLPLNIFNIISDLNMSFAKPSYDYYLINSICILFAMSSAVSNPFLYGFLNENFKREYVILFGKITQRLPFIKKAQREECNAQSRLNGMDRILSNANLKNDEKQDILKT